MKIRKISVFAVLFIICAVSVFSQTYNRSLIDAVLIYPKYGVSKVDRFDLIIQVSNASACGYSSNPNLNYSEILPSNKFTTTDNLIQKIVDFSLPLAEGEKKILYVLCKTPSGYVNDGFPINITLGVDRTEPNILSAAAVPSLVMETPKTTLTVKTDDESICRFDRTPPPEMEFLAFFEEANITKFNKTILLPLIPPFIEDNNEYTYTVTCMNRAGLFALDIETITFSVNLSAENRITRTSPNGYIRNSTLVDIWVDTNRDATCKYALDSTNYVSKLEPEHSKIHLAQRTNLEEGKIYTYNVRCEFDQGTPSILESAVVFTIDKTAPKAPIISADSQTCKNTFLNATFATNDTDIASIYYKISDSKGNVIINTTLSPSFYVVADNLNLNRGEKYMWEVYAVDLAGNKGSVQKTLGTTVLNTNDTACRVNSPPNVNKAGKMTESGVTLTLECKDDDGSCLGMYYLAINSMNPLCTCTTCNFTKYDLPVPGIKENTTFCYKAGDNKNLTVSGFFKISFMSCPDTEKNCCGRKKAMICDESCTTINVTECSADKLDSDGDGITDTKEINCTLDPYDKEDALLDNDNDGLTNKDECLGTNGFTSDINKEDTDGDTYNDKEEMLGKTNPNNKNSFPKDPKKDTDKDGIADFKETECGLDPNKDDAELDNDEDGLTNSDECLNYGTSIDEADTDGDKVSDKTEVNANPPTDPTDSDDYPKSNALTIILFVVLLGAIGGGAYFVVKKGGIKLSGSSSRPKQQNTMQPLPGKSIGVDFSQAKKELNSESAAPAQIQNKEADLDYQIKKKKEWLRMRQMSSIFDEFAQEQKKEYPKNEALLNEKNKERAEVFDRLDDISNNTSYEERNRLKKKKLN